MPKSAAQVIGLPSNATAGFAVGWGGVRMTCLSGTLWVTFNDDPQDYLLTAGQHVVRRSQGRLVVEATAKSPARFLLQPSDGR